MSLLIKRQLASLIRNRLAQAGLLTVAAVVILAPLVQAQTHSITTTYESNAGFSGNMFDVTATNTVTIVGFDIHVTRTVAENVLIYYKSGSYVGHETNPASWTLLGTDTVTGAGRGFPTPVDIGGLVIPAGETVALYITLESNNIEYTNVASTYSDANLTLELGAGLGGMFGANAVHSPRTWNGTIYYETANTPPAATDDSGTGYATDEDTAFPTANVLGNDTDADGDTLSVVGVDTTGLVGNLTDNGDGTFNYDPNGLFESMGVGVSASDVFTYTVGDGNGGTDTATVTISIAGVNDDPVAGDNIGAGYGTDEDTAFSTANVLGNDTDVDGDTLSVVDVGTAGLLGNLTDNGDGTFDYDPNGMFEDVALGASTTDVFTYTVGDGNGGTDAATVTISIAGVNDAPVAVDDSGTGYETDEDTAITTARVLDNDSDPEDDALTIVSVDATGLLGDLTDNGNGTFLYDPDGQFEDLSGVESATDLFTYTISDGNGLTDTATVSITVNGANDAPVAEDDDYVTAFETPMTVPVEEGVLSNDTDAEDDPLTALPHSHMAGALAFWVDGSFEYWPPAGFTGRETFTYNASDGLAASNVATVTINVLDPTDVDLEMEKVTSAETPIEGDTVVYTLTVTNNGPADATGIEISDTLPSGVTYVADDGAADYDGTTWAVGDLDADASATLRVTVTVDAETAGTTITNTAVISASDQNDPLDGNDEAQAVITVVEPQVDLELIKNVDNKTPDETGTIVYTLMVTNNGPRDATGVEISDTLPSGVTYVDDDGGGDYDGTTWTVSDLGATDSTTLHITATVDVGTAGSIITNTAVISALDQVDPDLDNNDAQAVIEAQEPADVDPPIVTIVSPEDGATGVPLGEDVVITFNEAINTVTFTYTVALDPGGWIEAWNAGMTQVTLSHDDFERGTTVTVTVTGAENLAGNPMGGPYAWSFTTESHGQFMPIVTKGLSYQPNQR